MKKNFSYQLRLLFGFTLLVNSCLIGQQFSFRRLDVNDGLPINSVAQAAFDRNGSLWFSTGDAMNLFDGNNLIQFHWRTYPFIPQNETNYFSIDSRNRVWACYLSKLVMVDEKRRLQLCTISDSLKDITYSYCFEAVGTGIIALTSKGAFYTTDIKTGWNKLSWFDSLRNNRSYALLNRFDSSSFFIRMRDRLMLVNFNTRKILLDVSMPEQVEVCKINDDEVLAGVKYKWKFYRISLSQEKIIKTYSETIDANNKPIFAELQNLEQAADGKIYIATRFSGLAQFDPAKEIFQVFRHDFLSAQSVSSDNLRFLATNADGYLAVTSRAGLNITNVFQTSFAAVEFFREPDGNIIDEGIVGLVEDRKMKIWVITQTKLFTWQPQREFVQSLLDVKDLTTPEGVTISPGIPTIDDNGRIWIPYTGYGILIYNDNGKLQKELTAKKYGALFREARVVRKDDKGRLFIGTNNGLFILDGTSFKPDTVTLRPLIDSMRQRRVVDILPDGNNIWVTTSPAGAVYNFNILTRQVKVFTDQRGIASKRNYLLSKDKVGNIYVSSYDGASVLSPDGKIGIIDEHSGLADIRVESVVTDNDGKVWMTNIGTLIRYDPLKKTFDYFNERNGINKTGFLITPPCKTHDGKLIFGLNRGLIVVDPSTIHAKQLPLAFSIYKVNTDNTIEICDAATPIALPHNNAKITFSYLNSDLISGNRIFYRYKMTGMDTSWSTAAKNHLIAYNLRPGNYRFQMQASYNETNWIDFPNIISIRVAAPFWQQWWFYVLIGVIAIVTTHLVFRFIQASKEQKRKLEELNRMMNESRLMAIRAQMNPHFIFNSLNAIQECIVMQDFDTAYQYLSKFSKLLRQVLNNSEQNFISLKDEIEVNQLYLELESLRFKRSFSYSFRIDEKIDVEAIKFPSLLLQPYIENAIWHGLMHKHGEKKLDISFALKNNHLDCLIEDNGIGRERSSEIKKNKLGAQYFESKGTKLSGQRIQLLNESGHPEANIHVDDLKNNKGEPTGTRVVLHIPLDYQT